MHDVFKKSHERPLEVHVSFVDPLSVKVNQSGADNSQQLTHIEDLLDMVISSQEKIMSAITDLQTEVQDLKDAEAQLKQAVADVGASVAAKLQTLADQIAALQELVANNPDVAAAVAELDATTKTVLTDVEALKAIATPPAPAPAPNPGV